MKCILSLSSSLLLLLLFNGCNPPESITPSIPAGISNGVWIVNEGNFQSANSSISYFDATTSLINNSILTTLNPSFTLGDVAQSMYFYRGYYFVVVNNSGKIEVFDEQLHWIKSIRSLNSPRYMVFSGDTFFVSNLYSNTLDVGSVSGLSKLSSIPTQTWTESMVTIGDSLYISCPNKNIVLVVNKKTATRIDSIEIGGGPYSLVSIGDTALCIAYYGNSTSDGGIALYSLNNKQKRNVTSWPTNLLVSKLGYDPNTQDIYWINKDVYQYNLKHSNAPVKIINGQQKNYYAIGINPVSPEHYLWLSDAKDFVQASDIFVYNKNKNPVNQFTGGIISGYFLFQP